MKFISNIGFILLAIFLILFGLGTFGLMIPVEVTGVIAIVSAIFILIGR